MFRSIAYIGLRARFILIGTAILVPLVAVMLQLAQYERDSALAGAKQRVQLFASLTADRQFRLVQQAKFVLSQIAIDWQALAKGNDCNDVLSVVLDRHDWMAGLRVSALDGSGVCAHGPEFMEPNLSERSYFKAVLAVEGFVVSDQIISRGAGKPIIVAAVPVLDGNQPIAVLSAAIELEALADLLPIELSNNPGVVVDVIDRNGVLLARHPHDPQVIGRLNSDQPVIQRALQEPSGTAELPDLEGSARLFAFQKIDSVGWVVAVGISRASVVAPIERSLHKRLGLIAAIVLSSCLVGLVGGEVLVFWPLRALARTAQALERGDMAARPPLTGLSEVGDLERALNGMAEAIQRRESDLKASEARWEQAVRDTKQANEAKSQFLASMSHEIRTPLSGIVGYNDLLLGQKLNPEQRRYAEHIESAAAAVITIIDEILDIARIEAREVEIEQRPLSLPALLDSAVSIIRPSAERKGLDLTVDLDPELPVAVMGDEARLRQVLLNLLTNAVKFTTSGSVTLRAHRADTGERVRFAVLDTGIGIAEEQHHRLFQRFAQVHRASRRDYGGTGLGLAISKELIGLMGGQLGLASKPGQGSTFWVELPLPRAEASEIERHPATAQSPKAGRILVADDYEMNREITSALLTMAGHEVDVVADGAQALEAIGQKTYDLVLMDIEMRGMNGIVTIGRIRRLDSPARHVPVVALTANVLPQQIRAFKEAGMDDHLAKPFTRNQLINKVNLFLSPARASEGYVAKPSARAVAFDKKTLDEMKSLLGEQRTAAWVGTLRSQLEVIVSIDSKPISRRKLATTAHTLVSQAGSLGFMRLSRLSSELEEACVQRTDYTDTLGRVKKACRGALSKIDQIQSIQTKPLKHLMSAEQK